MKVLVLVILACVISLTYSKIVFVSEVSRHGARTPGKIFNFTVDPDDNFTNDKELTEVGRRQHFLIGHEVRHRYIEKEQLANSTYYFKEVEFFATNADRALESGMSQLAGMYPPSSIQHTLNDFQKKNALPPFEIDDPSEIIDNLGEKAIPFNLNPIFSESDRINYKIHFESSDCPTYRALSDQLRDSSEYQAIIAPTIEYLSPRLSELTQTDKTLSLKDMMDLCSYIFIADYHHKKLIFEYNQTDIKHCQDILQSKFYYIGWGHEDLWRLGSKVFYEDLITAMDKVIKGEKQAKIQLHFSHDYMLSLLMNGLGEQFTQPVLFASTVFFELHEYSSTYYVKTLYDDQPMMFGDCQEHL